MAFIVPKDYNHKESLKDRQISIAFVKRFMTDAIEHRFELKRVSAPVIIDSKEGYNDIFEGAMHPIAFTPPQGRRCEIVQSLAKWKKLALYKYGFGTYEGIYCDMNAIRSSEVEDNIHSYYVDQWDWEFIIKDTDRTMEKLKYSVRGIYSGIKYVEDAMATYLDEDSILPSRIKFITSQELEDKYPDLTPEEREKEASKKHKAIFVSQIGGKLKSGIRHGNRSPEYDDWSLNGDIIVYYPLLDIPLELSSMGIRVNFEVLKEQLRSSGWKGREKTDYYRMMKDGLFPQTIGGGIGQSRVCMLALKTAHIGEVQSSVWSDETRRIAKENNIHLL